MRRFGTYSVRMLVLLVSIPLLLICNRCIDPIEIDIPEQESLLVIDGLVTDQAGPYIVKLSWSSQLNQLQARPISQAEVFIEEEGGLRAELTEIAEGEYKTDSASFLGVVGKRYRLKVSLGIGQNYESDWVGLKGAPPLGDVYYEFGFLRDEEIPVQGAKFFLDTRDPEQKTQFYRWEWEDTWMHIAPFASGFH